MTGRKPMVILVDQSPDEGTLFEARIVSLRRLLQLGFLSPRIVEAIAAGHQPLDLTVIGLTRRIDLPLLWSAQEQVLGMR